MGGGRKLISLWLCSLALTACNDDDSIIDRTGGNNLQVEVSANFHSRAPIHGSTLPDNNPIGVTLTAKDGSSYDNQNYNNIPYSATTADGRQTWMPQDKPVTLSVTEGVAMAYWPYNADAADMTAVPVETDTQTDYMYSGNVTGLSNATPKAAFQMKHAMTLIRVNVVRGTYTAAGAVTAVTAASEAFCTSGTMNVSTGALAGLKGAETPFLEEPADAAITAAGRVTEFLVLPDVSVDAASVTLGVTVDGRKYNTVIEVSEAYKQGYIYTYNLTLDNTALNMSGVAVTSWEEADALDSSLKMTYNDDEYVVKIQVKSGTYTFKHNMQNFTGIVNWGDGTTTTYDTPVDYPTHTYATAGEYTVMVTGSTPKLFNSSETIYSELIHIGEKLGVMDMNSAFAKSELKKIHEGALDGCTKVTDFGSAFYYTGVTEIPEGLFDKCTEVISFGSGCGYGVFGECTGITSIPEGLFDNCTKVQYFNAAFYGTSITKIPEGLFDNCPDVIEFAEVFAYTKITSIPADLFKYNTKVEYFGWTGGGGDGPFAGCTALESIPTGLFDNCPEVVGMGCLFRNCENLKSIPEGLFDNNKKVENFKQAFSGCNNLTNIPEGLFDYNTKVTTFAGAFEGCESIIEIPTGLFDKCTEVTDFSSTFYKCSNLKTIPEGLFDYNTKVTNFIGTFATCTALTGIPTGLFDNNTKAIKFGGDYYTGTFQGCTGLTGESPYTTINVDGTDIKVHLYERSSYPEHFTAPTDYKQCFNGCAGLADIAEITAAGWN